MTTRRASPVRAYDVDVSRDGQLVALGSWTDGRVVPISLLRERHRGAA